MRFLEPEAVIKGANRIVAIYGRWPSFHDFEIVKVVFERNSLDDQWGPHITVYIHMCQIMGELADGHFVYDKHNVVGLLFRSVLDYSEQCFNHQNVIDDIEITLTHDEANNELYQVLFPGLHGIELALTCRKIEVASIESGIPPWSVNVEDA
jgi:Immunity protein 50